jgi:hypothetical protein
VPSRTALCLVWVLAPESLPGCPLLRGTITVGPISSSARQPPQIRLQHRNDRCRRPPNEGLSHRLRLASIIGVGSRHRHSQRHGAGIAGSVHRHPAFAALGGAGPVCAPLFWPASQVFFAFSEDCCGRFSSACVGVPWGIALLRITFIASRDPSHLLLPYQILFSYLQESKGRPLGDWSPSACQRCD